jgi:DNA-binding NtrC family response regulator
LISIANELAASLHRSELHGGKTEKAFATKPTASPLNAQTIKRTADHERHGETAAGRNDPMATVQPVTYPMDPMSRPVERNGKLRLLVVDEDTVTSSACCVLAAALGLVADTAPTPHVVRNILRDGAVDILLVDLSTLLGEGLALLDEIKELHPSVGVVVMSASGSVSDPVEVMRAGATEYLPKPFTSRELATVLERAMECCTVQGASRRSRETLPSSHGLGNIIGRSPEMDKLNHILSRVAKSSHPVLIMGERGVGKELVARTIHSNGLHPDRPFVPVDCRSLVPTLMASQLFGFVKKPSMDADRSKKDFLTWPVGGTLFLDNIGELPMDLQAKLLHALKEKDVSLAEVALHVAVHVRVLAGTDHDLAAMVQQGRFRKDLYYRLSVVNLRIPSLRERKQDIPLLATHFLEQMSRKTGTTHMLSDDVLRTLVEYEWPGNVGELENSIATACNLSSGFILHIGDLPTHLQRFYQKNRRATAVVSLYASPSELQRGSACSVPVLPIADLEKQAILNALGSSKGDKVLIARQLGIGRTTLYRKLKEYGISETGRYALEA